MIERSVINGRPATIMHLNADFSPAGGRGGALVKAVFDDGGSLFLVRSVEPSVKARSVPRRVSRRMVG